MSSNEPNAAAAESAVRQIGTEFRRLRTIRGERIEDIATYLDIKVTYLFGIEQGDLSVMPGKREAKSTIRSYADYLGLDGSGIVAPMDPIIASLDGDKAPPSAAQPYKLDRTSAVMLASSVVLGVVVGWSWLGDADQFDLLAPPGPADGVEEQSGLVPAEGETGDALALETASDKTTEALLADLRSALSEQGVDTLAATDAGDILDDVKASEKEELPVNVLATLVARQGEGAHIYEAENTDARVIVRAVRHVSVEVASQSRDYVWTRDMKPGEMMLVPNRDDLDLWTADGGGVEILLDGRVLPPLGPSGKVISSLPLAPADLEAVASADLATGGAKPTF